jgi:hypothetical protein
MKKVQMNSCKKCNEPVYGNYCSNCGQPAKLKRIDRHYIFQEIGNVLNINGKILYTIKGLLASPGKMVRQFIEEDRSRYVKPIPFIIITSLIYTLVFYFFSIFDYAQLSQMGESTVVLFLNWMQEYSGYANVMIGVFVAFFIRLFYRKSDYNIPEIFVLLCFVFGIGMLIFSVFGIFQALLHFSTIYISSLIVIAYFTWATGQFFNPQKAASYIKAFLSYILGMLAFSYLLILVGILIDIIIKQ